MDFEKILQRLKFIVYIYFFCSLLVDILFFVPSKTFLIFSTIGASSGLIAFGIATDVSINFVPFVRVAIMLWAILFPIALFVTYIMFIKKHFKPICILSAADAIIVVLWVLFAGFSGNVYGHLSFLPDALTSTGYTVLMCLYCHKLSKVESTTRRNSTGDGSLS